MNPLIGDKPLGHPNKDIIIIIRGVAPATTGATMAVPLFEKCGPSGTCTTVIKNQDPSMHMRIMDIRLRPFSNSRLVDLLCIFSRTESTVLDSTACTLRQKCV